MNKYGYFSILGDKIVHENYPKEQKKYLDKFMREMKDYPLQDLSNDHLRDIIAEKICQSYNSVDRKVLENFSNDAKSLLRELN